MKKSVLLSVFAVAGILFANTANAQKGFNVGIQATPQFSKMYNADDADNKAIDYKATFGAAFGINGGYNFNKNMGVGVEAAYSIQGQRYELNGTEMTQRINYLKIPVLFTYNTNPTAKVMFTAKAGPQLGIKLTSKLNDADGNELVDDTNDNFEDLTWGATAGAGVRINLAKNLYAEGGIRLDGAFTNAENEDKPEYDTDRAKTYNMNAGLEFGLKYFIR